MNRILLAVPGVFLTASLIACAASSGSDEGHASSNSAISASPQLMAACAAASTYSSDGPNDLDTPATASLPASLQDSKSFTSVVHFKAPIVGDVYAASNPADITLYDRNGTMLAMADENGLGGALEWWTSNDNPLYCETTPYNVAPGQMSSSSSGWSSSGTVGWADASTGDDDDSSETDGGVPVVTFDGGH